MPEGVTVPVSWVIKPEFANTFVEALRGMFPEIRLHVGFRDIRLLKSDADPSQFLLIEAWDAAQNFHDYAQFPYRDRRHGAPVGDDREPAPDGPLVFRPARRGASLAHRYPALTQPITKGAPAALISPGGG